MSNYSNQKKRELSYGPAYIHESIDTQEMVHAKKQKQYHTFYDYLRKNPPIEKPFLSTLPLWKFNLLQSLHKIIEFSHLSDIHNEIIAIHLSFTDGTYNPDVGYVKHSNVLYINSTNLNNFYEYVFNFSPIENVDYGTDIQIIGRDSGTVYSQQLPVPIVLVQNILSQFAQT